MEQGKAKREKVIVGMIVVVQYEDLSFAVEANSYAELMKRSANAIGRELKLEIAFIYDWHGKSISMLSQSSFDSFETLFQRGDVAEVLMLKEELSFPFSGVKARTNLPSKKCVKNSFRENIHNQYVALCDVEQRVNSGQISPVRSRDGQSPSQVLNFHVILRSGTSFSTTSCTLPATAMNSLADLKSTLVTALNLNFSRFQLSFQQPDSDLLVDIEDDSDVPVLMDLAERGVNAVTLNIVPGPNWYQGNLFRTKVIAGLPKNRDIACRDLD